MAGVYRPDEGEVRVDGQVAPLLSFTGGLRSTLTGWQNIDLSAVLLGVPRREVEALKPRIAEFSGIGEFIHAPVRVYSAGMRARLGFGVAVYCGGDILLFDEMITVGDQEFRRRSEAKIRELVAAGATALVSSHSLEALCALCDRFVRLDKGRVVEDGPPQDVTAHYLAEQEPS
jgi:ABC-type polysaccharide/polyol phosphate transport system ATPase subunit